MVLSCYRGKCLKPRPEKGRCGRRARLLSLLSIVSVCRNIILEYIGCKQMKGQKHRGAVSNKSLLICQALKMKNSGASCHVCGSITFNSTAK